MGTNETKVLTKGIRDFLTQELQVDIKLRSVGKWARGRE